MNAGRAGRLAGTAAFRAGGAFVVALCLLIGASFTQFTGSVVKTLD